MAHPADDKEAQALPAHIEETIAAIARLQAEHRQGATALQRSVETATRFVGRPRFAGLAAIVVALWAGGDLIGARLGLSVPDPPPLSGLQVAASVLALFITLFILITERRENELTELREQLTLELAMASDQKAAKIIALLEELRRDLPDVRDRHDPQAEDLAQPADPAAVLDALKESEDESAAGPRAGEARSTPVG